MTSAGHQHQDSHLPAAVEQGGSSEVQLPGCALWLCNQQGPREVWNQWSHKTRSPEGSLNRPHPYGGAVSAPKADLFAYIVGFHPTWSQDSFL